MNNIRRAQGIEDMSRDSMVGTHTRIHAAIVLALQIAAAVDVVQALAPVAMGERIATESRWAGADWSSAGCLLADGVHPARIPAASVGLGGC